MMVPSSNQAEFTLLWREWLYTPAGKGYEAGWGDYESRLQAAKGNEWVMMRMIKARDEEIVRLKALLEALP